MNRIQLISSIECSDFVSTLYNYFDENNALYDVVHPIENKVDAIEGEVVGSSIQFHLKLKTNEAEQIASQLDGRVVPVCKRELTTTACKEQDNTVCLKIS